MLYLIDRSTSLWTTCRLTETTTSLFEATKLTIHIITAYRNEVTARQETFGRDPMLGSSRFAVLAAQRAQKQMARAEQRKSQPTSKSSKSFEVSTL